MLFGLKGDGITRLMSMKVFFSHGDKLYVFQVANPLNIFRFVSNRCYTFANDNLSKDEPVVVNKESVRENFMKFMTLICGLESFSVFAALSSVG
jgi:hypothetical protein